jgi:hypothetical protein
MEGGRDMAGKHGRGGGPANTTGLPQEHRQDVPPVVAIISSVVSPDREGDYRSSDRKAMGTRMEQPLGKNTQAKSQNLGTVGRSLWVHQKRTIILAVP